MRYLTIYTKKILYIFVSSTVRYLWDQIVYTDDQIYIYIPYILLLKSCPYFSYIYILPLFFIDLKINKVKSNNAYAHFKWFTEHKRVLNKTQLNDLSLGMRWQFINYN